jgi:hypothetical protein
VEHFEIEADEFKRHCSTKGVTLNTIQEAFSNCKPKAVTPEAVILQQRASAAQVAQKKHQKKNSISSPAHTRPAFK